MISAYTREQVDAFLKHIDLPQELHHAPPSLCLLQQLHTHIISSLPYENLSLHYNPSHRINIDPQHLFTKMITHSRGRGGHCMEIALLYYHMLRAMGFNAYTAGVRTRPRVHGIPTGDFPGWGHVVSIVTLPDGSKYHEDVAFGGDGPTAPLPLIDGYVHQNLGTQEVRLSRDWISTQVHRTEDSKLWLYQYRNQPDTPWLTFCAFPEIEFMQPDWGVLNHWMELHPDSNHVRNVLVVKFLRDEHAIYGKVMLVNDVVKRNLGGKTETVQELKNEAERIEALERWFGITLTEQERTGIETSPRRIS